MSITNMQPILCCDGTLILMPARARQPPQRTRPPNRIRSRHEVLLEKAQQKQYICDFLAFNMRVNGKENNTFETWSFTRERPTETEYMPISWFKYDRVQT